MCTPVRVNFVNALIDIWFINRYIKDPIGKLDKQFQMNVNVYGCVFVKMSRQMNRLKIWTTYDNSNSKRQEEDSKLLIEY